MSQIKQDPEKLRHFAYLLTSHASHWEQSVGSLNSYMARLEQTWRDEQSESFRKEVAYLSQSLELYSRTTRLTVAALEEDAEKLDSYLKLQL